MVRYRVALLALGMVVIALAVAAPAGARPTAAAATKATKVTVTEGKPSELRYTLSKSSVPKGSVTFNVVNKGKLGHDFKVCTKPSSAKPNSCKGKGTIVIKPGKSATLAITFAKAGTYEYICTVPGHAAAGMKGVLKVS